MKAVRSLLRTRPVSILMLCQAVLCLIETYLIARISLIGKIGIALVHREYRLLRSGWKTFAMLFSLQLLVILVMYIIRRRRPASLPLLAWLLMGVAIVGLLMTYFDFQHTYTHRLLKERFHLGFYLFWFSWIGSCVFFLTHPSAGTPPDKLPQDEQTEAQAPFSDL